MTQKKFYSTGIR